MHADFFSQNMDLSNLGLQKIDVSKVKIYSKITCRRHTKEYFKLFLSHFARFRAHGESKLVFFLRFLLFFVKKTQKIQKLTNLGDWNFMERHIVDSFVAPKILAYLLTLATQSFMALHRIIIDIGENMSRGGVHWVYPPPGNPKYHILQKKIGVINF